MDNQNGLVVGDGGLMLVTSDSGKTWEKMEVDMQPPGAGQRPGGGGGPPPGFGRGGPAPLYNIYFVDENVGYITGGRGTILKTEDGVKHGHGRWQGVIPLDVVEDEAAFALI